MIDEEDYEDPADITYIPSEKVYKKLLEIEKKDYGKPYIVEEDENYYLVVRYDLAERATEDDLWNEKFKDSLVMPDSVRDAFMIALKKLGYSENATSEDEIKAAADELIKQKPLVYKYANDSARDLLANGSAAVGVVWNGEYIYTKDLNEDVEFVIPKEGSEFFVDSWVIPKDAVNKANAEAWINYLCKAEVAAKNFDYLYYTTPNEAALELIDEEYLNEKAVFPDKETIERCESLVSLDPATTDLYSDYWKKIKAE